MNRTQGIILIIVQNMILGVGYSFIKVFLQGFPHPLRASALSCGITGLFLLGAAWMLGECERIKIADIFSMSINGVLFRVALPSALSFLALQNVYPIMLAFFSILITIFSFIY
jgi:hypothetical protein